MNDLKPGDRAWIIGTTMDCAPATARYLGTACTVTTAAQPHPLTILLWLAGMNVRKKYHEVEFYDGMRGYVVPQRLVKIPPDDELHRMFRETEKPLEVHA